MGGIDGPLEDFPKAWLGLPASAASSAPRHHPFVNWLRSALASP